MPRDPTTIFGLAEAGVKQVAPLLLAGGAMVVAVLWLWPDPTGALKQGEGGAALLALGPGADGGRAALDDLRVALGAPVQLAANLPLAATVAVFQVAPDGAVAPLWPLDGGAPERSSAGRLVELPGKVPAPGPPGRQRWVLSLCQLGAEAPACSVRSGEEIRCPEGCVTAVLPAQVLGPP